MKNVSNVLTCGMLSLSYLAPKNEQCLECFDMFYAAFCKNIEMSHAKPRNVLSKPGHKRGNVVSKPGNVLSKPGNVLSMSSQKNEECLC